MSFLPDKTDKNGKPIHKEYKILKFVKGKLVEIKTKPTKNNVIKNLVPELIYKDLEKDIKNKKLIDDFINYLERRSPITKDFYDDYRKEFVEYQKLENKIKFVPLTLEYVSKNIGKEIKYHYSNGGDPNDIFGPYKPNIKDRNKIEEVFDQTFVPNGHIMIKDFDKKVEVTYIDWFKNQQVKLKPKQFIFILGKTDFDDNAGLQLCDPFMYNGKLVRQLSDNCKNGTSWIKK